MGTHCESHRLFLEGGDSYNIDYSAETGKIRCTPEIVSIVYMISGLVGRGGGIRIL
jgi:hypothetical protein